MTRLIFVTGGVVSSLGKGIAAASLAAMLEARGLRVTLLKLDPYINVDPGTMSPFQHGEVFVTDDGAETDLDLGHYERFVRTRMTCRNNFTTGKVYEDGAAARAPRRLPRRHGAGDPAHHRRDQAPHPRRRRGLRRGAGRDRRHGRRHRVAALPGGEPAAARRAGRLARAVHPPHAGALHRHGRRDQDQAHPALRQGAALDRPAARHPAVPLRGAHRRSVAPKIALFTNVRRARGHPAARRRLDLPAPAAAAQREARRLRAREARPRLSAGEARPSGRT